MAVIFSGRFKRTDHFTVYTTVVLPTQPWMIYAARDDQTVTFPAFPASTLYETKLDSDPSKWFTSYSGSADPTARSFAAFPTETTYSLSRDVPEGSWWTYAASTDPSARSLPDFPVTAAYAPSRDVPNTEWFSYNAASDVRRDAPAFPTTAVQAQ